MTEKQRTDRRDRLPGIARYILERFCHEDYLEEFQGDLEELHRERIGSRVSAVAHLLLLRDLASFARARFRRRARREGAVMQPELVANYLRVAWRSISRNRGVSTVNLLGLGAGLACCLLIGLYIQDELSYDRFHERGDRLFRVVSNETEAGRTARRASTYFMLAPTLKGEFDLVEAATRFYPYSGLVASPSGQRYQEDGMAFVDSTFLDMFSFPVRSGDATTALSEPFSLVLTASTARRYFGSDPAVGEILSLRTDDGVYDFTVRAVVDDVPVNSSIQFDMLASVSSLRTFAGHMFSWYWPPIYTFALLRDARDASTLRASFPDFESKYLQNVGVKRTYGLQSLTDIHLRSGLENEMAPVSSLRHVRLFGFVAVLILFIASINFTNLATARSAARAREVGMRKALGARRTQVAGQFLSESLVTAFMGLAIALLLTAALLPLFNSVTGKTLVFGRLMQGLNPVYLFSIAAIVGSVTGLYPALFLSAFRPIRVLKGLVSARGSAAGLVRRGLVIVQFAITSALIVGAIVIDQQLDFLQNERLGFDKEHVVVIPLRDMANQMHHDSLKELWTADPRIVSASASSGYPGHLEGLHDFTIVPHDARSDSTSMLILTADEDFAETYGLEIVSGRDLSDTYETDASSAFLINEAAARKLGWTDPIGKELTLSYYVMGHVDKPGRVVGVVRDFQYMSFHRALDPIVFHVQKKSFYNDFISVRLAGNDLDGALKYLTETWASFNADRPLEYRFVDEVVDEMYRSDTRLGRVLGSFAMLALLIACIGLFALAAYTTEQRTREIGVRKALGASVGNVIMLLSRQFIVLVVVAFIVAVPPSFFALRNWLDGFAARISLGAGTFFIAGAVALAIGVLSVAYTSIRAATANPAVSLRHE